MAWWIFVFLSMLQWNFLKKIFSRRPTVKGFALGIWQVCGFRQLCKLHVPEAFLPKSPKSVALLSSLKRPVEKQENRNVKMLALNSDVRFHTSNHYRAACVVKYQYGGKCSILVACVIPKLYLKRCSCAFLDVIWCQTLPNLNQG